MKTKLLSSIYLISLSVLFAACGNQKEQTDDCSTLECEQQALYDQIIIVHDEVMPKLSEISTLKARIEAQMNLATDSLVKIDWLHHLKALDAADESMWVWMRQFDSQMDSVATDTSYKYFENQKIEVDEVAVNIKTSISVAEKALEAGKP